MKLELEKNINLCDTVTYSAPNCCIVEISIESTLMQTLSGGSNEPFDPSQNYPGGWQ